MWPSMPPRWESCLFSGLSIIPMVPRILSFNTSGRIPVISQWRAAPPLGVISTLHLGTVSVWWAWGQAGPSGALQASHWLQAHVAPFSEASAEMFLEKLETSQLPTSPGVKLCKQAWQMVGRPALQRAWNIALL